MASKSYYLDSLGRPRCGESHKPLKRTDIGEKTLIFRKEDAESRGVPYGTPVHPPTPGTTTAPPPAPPPVVGSAPPALGPVAPAWAQDAPQEAPRAPAAPVEATEAPTGLLEPEEAPPAASVSIVATVTPPDPATREAMELIFGTVAEVFGAVVATAAVAGTEAPPIPLTKPEKEKLAQAFEVLANHYTPTWQPGPVSALVMVTATIAIPRRMLAMRHEAEAVAKAEAEDN